METWSGGGGTGSTYYGGRLIIDGVTIYDSVYVSSPLTHLWTPVDGAVITFSRYVVYDSGVTLTQIEIVTTPAPAGYTLSYYSEHGAAPSPVADVNRLTSAMLPTLTETGYTFRGWYYESSFDTQAQAGDVLSADTTLYAKWQTASTLLDVTYQLQKIIDAEEVIPPITVEYDGETIATLNAGDTKLLFCNGKVMADDVVIGSKTLLCNGKRMADDVRLHVWSGET